MSNPIDNKAIAQLFTEARTHHAWMPQPVSDSTLVALYELMKWGPTSVNGNPGRVLFIRSDEQKEKLYPALLEGNVDQIKAAPVTAIVAYDQRWLDHMNRLFPIYDVRPFFEGNDKLITDTAFRNSSLQGAYLILAARALGLDTCPMSGFDNDKVDETFFEGSSWGSNFICALGHGDSAKLFPRGPRLTFDEACKII
jgi:3-hydroxypropanoate dehydrogenase